jgi:hypothetical protein
MIQKDGSDMSEHDALAPESKEPESDSDDEEGRVAAQESLARGVCPAADKGPKRSGPLGAFPLAASYAQVVDRRRYAGFGLERRRSRDSENLPAVSTQT